MTDNWQARGLKTCIGYGSSGKISPGAAATMMTLEKMLLKMELNTSTRMSRENRIYRDRIPAAGLRHPKCTSLQHSKPTLVPHFGEASQGQFKNNTTFESNKIANIFHYYKPRPVKITIREKCDHKRVLKKRRCCILLLVGAKGKMGDGVRERRLSAPTVP